MGGGNTFRTLQTPQVGIGIGTERKTISDPGGQAKAVTLLEKNIQTAQALEKSAFSVNAKGRLDRTPEADAKWLAFFHGEIERESVQHTHEKCPVYRRMHSSLGNEVQKKSVFRDKHLACEIMPPIMEYQAAELMNYYYCSWLSKTNPKDEQLAMKVKSYGEAFTDAFINIKSNHKGDEGRAHDFLLAVKKTAFRRAQDMITKRLETDRKIADSKRSMDENLTRFAKDEVDALDALQKFYVNKAARLTRKIESGSQPSHITEKIKKIAAKIGISAGAILTGLGTFLNDVKHAIKDFTEHIPFVSSLPPELVGAWIVGALLGGWVLGKGFAKAVLWHFEIIRDRLPKREAYKKANARKEFDSMRDRARQDFERRSEEAISECAANHLEVGQKLKEEYQRIVSQYGYLSPN